MSNCIHPLDVSKSGECRFGRGHERKKRLASTCVCIQSFVPRAGVCDELATSTHKIVGSTLLTQMKTVSERCYHFCGLRKVE